ncbi:hypothetical protein GGS21DRAFT_224197 [Xylaria nigripes]|nr:hypothetical protein GGS21DRAFT_224197 [Xylaria nigripes]
MDHYKVLDVSPDADIAAIEKAFKVMSLKHHPDKANTASKPKGTETDSAREAREKLNNERYVNIVNAREVLTNPAKRREYDEKQRVKEEPIYDDDGDDDGGDDDDYYRRRRRTGEREFKPPRPHRHSTMGEERPSRDSKKSKHSKPKYRYEDPTSKPEHHRRRSTTTGQEYQEHHPRPGRDARKSKGSESKHRSRPSTPKPDHRQRTSTADRDYEEYHTRSSRDTGRSKHSKSKSKYREEDSPVDSDQEYYYYQSYPSEPTFRVRRSSTAPMHGYPGPHDSREPRPYSTRESSYAYDERYPRSHGPSERSYEYREESSYQYPRPGTQHHYSPHPPQYAQPYSPRHAYARPGPASPRVHGVDITGLQLKEDKVCMLDHDMSNLQYKLYWAYYDHGLLSKKNYSDIFSSIGNIRSRNERARSSLRQAMVDIRALEPVNMCDAQDVCRVAMMRARDFVELAKPVMIQFPLLLDELLSSKTSYHSDLTLRICGLLATYPNY